MPPTQTDEGARAAKAIRERHPDVGLLLLSQIVEPRHALDLFSEHPEGFGYLLKDRVLEIDDFLDAVRRVARGGTVMDSEVVSQLLGRRRAPDPLEAPDDHRRVLAVLAFLRSWRVRAPTRVPGWPGCACPRPVPWLAACLDSRSSPPPGLLAARSP